MIDKKWIREIRKTTTTKQQEWGEYLNYIADKARNLGLNATVNLALTTHSSYIMIGRNLSKPTSKGQVAKVILQGRFSDHLTGRQTKDVKEDKVFNINPGYLSQSELANRINRVVGRLESLAEVAPPKTAEVSECLI